MLLQVVTEQATICAYPQKAFRRFVKTGDHSPLHLTGEVPMTGKVYTSVAISEPESFPPVFRTDSHFVLSAGLLHDFHVFQLPRRVLRHDAVLFQVV